MKIKRSEKNIVVVLFFLVLITFSLAQEQSRVIERVYTGKSELQTKSRETLLNNSHAQITGHIIATPVKTY